MDQNLYSFDPPHLTDVSSVFRVAGDWKAVNEELVVSCRYVIKNQTTGDRLNIRVVAVNAGGRSPPATLADAVLVREVVGKSWFSSSIFSLDTLDF